MIELTAIVAAAAEGSSLYVSRSGNDANSGTSPQSAFQTIAKAISTAISLQTSTILLSMEVHQLHATLNLTSLEGIAFKAYGAAQSSSRAVISGGVPITGWQRSKTINGDHQELVLWEADVPKGASFNQLFLNGTRGIRARTPNIGQNFIWAETPCTKTHCCTSKGVSDNCKPSVEAAYSQFSFSAVDAAYMPSTSERSEAVNVVVYHGVLLIQSRVKVCC